MVGPFRAETTPDSPRVIPGTHCNSSSWKWWPGTDRFAKRIRTAQLPEGRGSAQADPSQSNHRHADFQYGGEPGSARASRRPGRGFSEPTEPPCPTEPIPSRNGESRTNQAVSRRSARASGHRDRTVSELRAERGPAGPTSARPASQSGRRAAELAECYGPLPTVSAVRIEGSGHLLRYRCSRVLRPYWET